MLSKVDLEELENIYHMVLKKKIKKKNSRAIQIQTLVYK